MAPLSKVYASASRLRRLEALLAVLLVVVVVVVVAVDTLSPVPIASLALDSHYALPQKCPLVQPAILEAQRVSGLIELEQHHAAAAHHLRDPVHLPRVVSLRRNRGTKEYVSM